MTDFYTEAEIIRGGRFINLPSEIGAGFKGALLGPPDKRPKMFDGKPVLTRDTGQPRYEHVITFQTDQRDPDIDDDDGIRKYGMNEGDFSSFVEAWKKVGKPNPIDGWIVLCRVVAVRDKPTSWDTREFKLVEGEKKAPAPDPEWI